MLRERVVEGGNKTMKGLFWAFVTALLNDHTLLLHPSRPVYSTGLSLLVWKVRTGAGVGAGEASRNPG